MSGLLLTISEQVSDTLTFSEPLQDATEEDTFAQDSVIILYRDGVKWFQGIITAIVPEMTEQTEVKRYVVQGGWYYLENHVFKQIWKTYTGDPDNLGQVRSSEVILGMSNNLASFQKQNSKQQIQEVLDYAITTSGAPLSYDLTDCPEIDFPVDQKTDITCGDAIRQVLRWIPDAVVSWDYSTTNPTFKVVRRGDLPLITLPGFDGVRVKRLAPIALRSDLNRPAVVFRYKYNNSSNGTNWTSYIDDAVPSEATGDELRALVMTINLQGMNQTFSTAEIVTEEIQRNTVAWWQARVPWLLDPTIEEITLSGTTREGDLAYELIDGSFVDWMGDQGFSAESDLIEADVTVTFEDGTKRVEHMSVNVNTTDAPTAVYTNVDSFDEGEPAPVGLAQVFYDALNRDEYEGRLGLVEQDCTGDVTVGKRLRITGGKAGWATMDAIIYECAMDIDNGQTSVAFGPPPWLSAGDLIDLLRVNRTRFNFTSRSQRINARAGRDTSVDLPKQTAKQNSATGKTKAQREKLTKLTDSSRYIDLDSDKAVDTSGTARPLEVREVSICVDGVTKKMLVLASVPYA